MNMKNTIVEIKISDIKIGERFRKDMGDLKTFARSLDEAQLQPIGVTPQYDLIFGERRLLAYRDVLHRDTILARIIPIKSIMHAQIAENTMRKNFTPSELVAIVQTLRSFTHGGDRRSNQVRNCDNEALTTEEALRRVGWSKDTFARAQRVVENGTPELVEAMDSKQVSVFAASELALAKPDEQRSFLARIPNEGRWTACAVRRQLRRLKNAKQRAADARKSVRMPAASDAARIYHCPFQKLEQVAEIRPGSATLFCTDIPYGQEFLPQVSDLGAMASRVLDDGGLFVMYCGQYYLPEVLRRLGEHLTYRWECSAVWEGDSNVIHPLGITSQWKPIVVYSKGPWRKTGRFSDVFRMHAKEKIWHDWQQPIADVEKLVEYFSQPGDLVIDPCGGGFTTAIACHRLRRRFIGCDIDKAAVASGQRRLAEERAKPELLSMLPCKPLPPNSVTRGDCKDLIPRLSNGCINLCVTSPPYAEQRKHQYASVPEETYPEFTLRWMTALEPKLTEDGSVLIVIDPHVEKGVMADYVLRTQLLLRAHGWKQHKSLIWEKMDRLALGHRQWPRHCYEEILWFSRTSKPFCDPWAAGTPSDRIGANNYGHSLWTPGKRIRKGIARITDVIVAPVGTNEKGLGHPAQFPPTLVEPLIKTFCPEGGTVLDPFAGSGTTLIAAAALGRKWFGFDISAEYCRLARQRLTKRRAAVRAG